MKQKIIIPNLSNGRVDDSIQRSLVILDKLVLNFTTRKDLNRNRLITEKLNLKTESKQFAYKKFNYKQKLKSKLNKYRLFSEVYYNSEKVAYLFYNEQIKHFEGQIVFKNKTFYTNFNCYFNNLVVFFGNENVSINEIDIAYDVNSLVYLQELKDRYSIYCKDEIYLLNGTKFRAYDKENSYYIGNENYINIYNKLKEIKTNKNYILDFYEKNKLNLSNGITRFELRLNRKTNQMVTRIIKAINLNKIVDFQYLKDICCKVFSEKLVLKHKVSKNASRNPSEKLLSIDFKNKIINNISYADSNTMKRKSIRVIKTLLKKLSYELMDAKLNLDIEIEAGLENLIKKRCQMHNLKEWYKDYTKTELKKEYQQYKRNGYC